jgi:exodeoxyribonuclease V beta subunit
MKTVLREKPDVLARIPLDRHASIEASAGTGKTFTLEHLVVELLLQTETRIDELLVVTFTERATAELKARIRRTLETLLAQDQDEGNLSAPCWRLDDAARARLQAALGGLDGATIATLHGFCQRTLAEQAFDSGRLFEETQVDAREAFHGAFIDLLRRELAPEGKDPALAAWLSQGKTVEELETLLHDCAKERGVLRPVFDPAAMQAALAVVAGFDRARLDQELASKAVHHQSRPKVEKLLLPILDALPGLLGRTDALGVLTELEALASNEDARGYLPSTLAKTKTKAALLPALGEALQALFDAAPELQAAVVGALLPRVREALSRRKRDLGLFDFDDMLTLLRDALRGQRGPELARALRGRYRYALVDEFQDTDEVQWEIFRTVFHTAEASPVLYLIGDPKQAIYGFRGADVHTYLDARKTLLAAGGEPVDLDQNFRSTGALLGAVNRILDPDAPEPFFTGEVKYRAPVRCGRPELQLTDAAGQVQPAVELWQLVGAGKLTAGAVLAGIATEIARCVQRLADPALPGLFLQGKRLGPGDVYVLTRNAREGNRVGAALREAGVPVAFFKQEGLLQSPEAHAVRDLLAAIARPDDLPTLRTAWLTPFFGLTLQALTDLGEVPATHPLRARLHGWKALADARDYERLFPRILEESGLARRALFSGGAERALTNVQHVFELLLGEVHRARGPIDELLRALSAFIRESRTPPGADGNLQRLESDGQAVQVMTLHKSKGLEAPLVFVLGGFFKPPARTPATFHEVNQRCGFIGKLVKDSPLANQVQAELDEEHQRLLYVGLTRAAGRLVLPYFGPLAPAAEAAFTAREGSPSATLKGLTGAYQVLNHRLRDLDAAGALTLANGFAKTVVVCGRRTRIEAPQAVAPARWTPPPALLDRTPPDGRIESLRQRHAGFFITSYSRMAEHAQGPASDEDDALLKADGPSDRVELPEGDLPPGAESGIFLHALLERLPLADVARASDPRSFRALPAIDALLRDTARRHGIAPRPLEHAARMCFFALRHRLALPDGTTLPGIASADRVLREVEFLYPIPEAHHPRLGGPEVGGFTIERGCIKGFVDLIVEHQGRVVLADWKSDLLAAYTPELLAARVAERYALQEKLYTLALLRMLGVRTASQYEDRCGGSLYLFLRGMPEGQGVHASRPSWSQVQAFETELMERDDFGVAV